MQCRGSCWGLLFCGDNALPYKFSEGYEKVVHVILAKFSQLIIQLGQPNCDQ